MKSILKILLLFPGYVIFNNIIFNATGIPFGDYYIYIKGYFCGIDNFSESTRDHFIAFTLLRPVLYFLMLYMVNQEWAKKLALVFILYDLLSVGSLLIDTYTNLNTYSLFSSVQSTFFLSDYLSGIPGLLFIIQSAIFIILFSLVKQKLYWVKLKRLIVPGVISITIFQCIFLIYYLLI